MTSVFDAAFDAAVRNDGLPVGSQQILVSNATEFHAAIDVLSAGNGGTIIVASDAEPLEVFVRDAGSDTGKIVVTSEDPDNPSQMMTARVLDSQNVSFENLYFNSEGSDRVSYLTDAYVADSKNIAFVNNVFEGTESGALLESPDEVQNMSFFNNVDGLLLEGNHISGYVHTVRIFNSNDVLVESNEITAVQGDAIHGGGWQDVKISNNYIHDMYGSTQLVSHSDMIQLWYSNGLEGTDGVLIKGNQLDSGDGPSYQSIFIRNIEGGITHQNIHVEDNLIYNGHPHGIRISGAEDTVVDGNTVLWNQGASWLVSEDTSFDGEPRIYVDDPSGTIVNNIAGIITGVNGTVVGDNAIISYTDVNDPNYYQNHFVNADGGGARTVEELQLLPDSSFVGQYGSSQSSPTDTADEFMAIIVQSDGEGARGSVILDASLSRDESGFVDESDATFTWSFADGVVIEGISVARTFPTGDEMGVTLSIEQSDGTSTSTTRSLVFERNDIAEVDFSDGMSTNAYTFYQTNASDFETSNGNTVFHMDGTTGIAFDSQDSAWGGLSGFSLDIDISKDEADGTGRILQLNKAMKMYVDNSGRAIFELSTDEGSFSVQTASGALSDTDWHGINVTYDGDASTLSISVDGEHTGTVEASGNTPPQISWGFQLGANQHSQSLAARVDNFKAVGDPDLVSETQEIEIEQVAAALFQTAEIETVVESAPIQVPDPIPVVQEPEPEEIKQVVSEPEEEIEEADPAPISEPVIVVKKVAVVNKDVEPEPEEEPVVKATAAPISEPKAPAAKDVEPEAENEVVVEDIVTPVSEPKVSAAKDVESEVEIEEPADSEAEEVAEADNETQASGGSETFFSKLMSTLLSLFGFDRSSDSSSETDDEPDDEGSDEFGAEDDIINSIFFAPSDDGSEMSQAPIEDDEDDADLLLE